MRFIVVVLSMVFGWLALTGIADYYVLNNMESELTKAGASHTDTPIGMDTRILYVTPDKGVGDEVSN